MNFFCPRCESTVPVADGVALTLCPKCGLSVDLTRLATTPGSAQLPLVWDHTSEQLGPYRLETVLGSGGMGTVYKAVDSRDGKTVAVKLLYPQLSALPHLVERFRREAKALRMLVHPRIVQYIDEGESQGLRYLVMEYVEGENLERYLERHRPSTEQVLDMASQICEALDTAHAAGIVHRDLKPANIIVSPDGIRVLDFGIAQITSEDRTLTVSNAWLGTVNYMSPEQRLRSHLVDHRSDLYALGVILYFMFTGKLPLGAFDPVSRLNRQVSKRTDRLISRALQNDPDRRYQSAKELLADLSQLQKPTRTWMMAAAAMVLVLGLGGLGWYVWDQQNSSSDDQQSNHFKPTDNQGKEPQSSEGKPLPQALSDNQSGNQGLNQIPAPNQIQDNTTANLAILPEPQAPSGTETATGLGLRESKGEKELPDIKETSQNASRVDTAVRPAKPIKGKKPLAQTNVGKTPVGKALPVKSDNSINDTSSKEQGVDVAIKPDAIQKAAPEDVQAAKTGKGKQPKSLDFEEAQAQVEPQVYKPAAKSVQSQDSSFGGKGAPSLDKKPRLIVPRDGVLLYPAADVKQKPLSTISKGDTLEVLDRSVMEGKGKKAVRRWLKVKTADGQEGFVPSEMLSSGTK